MTVKLLGVSKIISRLHKLVYTCQNATLLEITCRCSLSNAYSGRLRGPSLSRIIINNTLPIICIRKAVMPNFRIRFILLGIVSFRTHFHLMLQTDSHWFTKLLSLSLECLLFRCHFFYFKNVFRSIQSYKCTLILAVCSRQVKFSLKM